MSTFTILNSPWWACPHLESLPCQNGLSQHVLHPRPLVVSRQTAGGGWARIGCCRGPNSVVEVGKGEKTSTEIGPSASKLKIKTISQGPMWPGSAYDFFSFSCIYQRSVSAGEAVTGMKAKWGFISVVFFPWGRTILLRRVIFKARAASPSPVHRVGRSSCAPCGWWSTQDCCSNYNRALHLNLSLAEAATCESDMWSSVSSYFLSWQEVAVLSQPSSFPGGWKGRVYNSEIRHSLSPQWENLEVVGGLAIT